MSSVATEFTYVTNKVARPGFYNYDAGPDAPDVAPETKRYPVEVTDVRDNIGALDLDKEGLKVVYLQTRAADLYDPEQVKSIYYKEIEKLVKKETGANSVLVFDYNIRNRSLAEQLGISKPVTFVHNDYTNASGPQRVRDLIGGDKAEALISRRFAVINVWKPITGPVLTSPLGVCDASSMRQDDFIETDLLYPDRNGEIYSVAWRPEHRWLYVSEMKSDEVMLLKCYDSDLGGRARFTAHSAFDIPDADGVPQRESIEVRTLAFF